MRYLITSSLLDGYDWMMSCPKNWQDRAVKDFIAMLKRSPRPSSEACERGMEFERLVCDNCNRMDSDGFRNLVSRRYSGRLEGDALDNAVNAVCAVAETCKGGEQQVAVTNDIRVGGKDFRLFGYADVVFPDRIIDIKTTANYKGDESYLRRSQHNVYSLCTGIRKFEYVVAVFRGKYPAEVKRVCMDIRDDEAMRDIVGRIEKVTNFIKRAGLWSDYENIFTGMHGKSAKNVIQ